MIEYNKELRRINSRNYRKKNKEKIKTRNQNYRKNHRERLTELGKQYREDNKDKLRIKKNEYTLNNKEKVLSSQRKSRNNTKKTILIAYGGSNPECACCGETDIESLCIDHINNGGNSHRKIIRRLAGYSFYVWLKQNNYPKGYRVLCMNCNDSLALFGYCPHKEKPLVKKSSIKSYFERIKLRVFNHYSNNKLCCAKCGINEIEFLCLDHNDVEHKRIKQRGGGWTAYKWVIDNNFPSGFQILCWSCNFKKWKIENQTRKLDSLNSTRISEE